MIIHIFEKFILYDVKSCILHMRPFSISIRKSSTLR